MSDEGGLPLLKETLIYSPEKVTLKGDAYFTQDSPEASFVASRSVTRIRCQHISGGELQDLMQE